MQLQFNKMQESMNEIQSQYQKQQQMLQTQHKLLIEKEKEISILQTKQSFREKEKITSLNEFFGMSEYISHKSYIDIFGNISYYRAWCNLCCVCPLNDGNSWAKSMKIDCNVSNQELWDITGSFKKHLISANHWTNKNNQTTNQTQIMVRLLRVCLGVFKDRQPYSNYEKEITRSIKNMGVEKSKAVFGDQHHSLKFCEKAQPIMKQQIQTKITQTLTRNKPSTNVSTLCVV